MNDPISRLVPFSETGFTSRLFDAPPQTAQVTAVSETLGNSTKETGADSDGSAREQLADLADRLNERMQMMRRSLRFNVDDASGRVVVKVVDQDSGEVIRQIPSEEVLAMMKHINDVDGLIFDAQA